MFLNICNGDVDLAAKKLDKYYELKQAMPEFFGNRDMDLPEIQNALDNLYYVALPLTPDDCYLLLHKANSPYPKDYHFDAALKTFIMKTEVYAYNNGPRSGSVFIDDLKGVCFGHLFRPSLSSIRKSLRFLQEGSPLEVKAVHFINTVPFFNVMLNIVKPFLWGEMLGRIHFHPSNMDWEKFYEEVLPKSCLPSGL